MTPEQFRADFPEFSDTTKYPNTLIQMWLTVAASLVNPVRWMELTNLGLALVTAHHLVLAQRDGATADVGGTPGEVKGPTSSKSVDKVSVSYDTGAVGLDGAGFWAMTSYGLRYLTMAKLFGAGGMQL